MLTPSRACCCVASPCNCDPSSSVSPYTAHGSAIYEVQFPGSSGRVQLSQIVTGAQAIIIGLPNNADPNAGPTGGIFCMSSSCVTPTNISSPCTFANGVCDVPFAECGVPTAGDNYAFVDGPTVVQDADFEVTTTTCGFELTDESGILMKMIVRPFPNICGTAPIYYCVNEECTIFGTSDCTPAYFDNQDSVVPTFGGGGGYCCPPYMVDVVQMAPRLAVGSTYSSAGTIRFTWSGFPTSTSFIPSLTSSNPGPLGGATISTVNCYYAHRNRSSANCGTSCTQSSLQNGSNCGACSSSCCCESEVCIAFNVYQDYDVLGFVGINQIGVQESTYAQNFVKAFYRGCHDPRLYDEATPGLPSRVFRLDRAQVTLATLPTAHLRKIQYSRPDSYVPPYDCLGADYGDGYVEASTSTVIDTATCTCQPNNSASESCLSFTREHAIGIGIPAHIIVNRISP